MGIVSIYGPPGSGKTSLAVDLSFANARQGRSVCLISADPYSELSAVLQVQIGRKNSLPAAYQRPGMIQQIAYPAADLLYVLSVPMGNDIFSMSESSPAVKQVLAQTRSLYDVVIVDCPAYADSALAAWALRTSDRILLLTGCRPRDGEWHKTYRRATWEVISKATYICTEIRENFDYHALYSLIGYQPEHVIPHVPDADAIRDTNRTLYGVSAGILDGKAARTALQRYSEAIDKLKSVLEVNRL